MYVLNHIFCYRCRGNESTKISFPQTGENRLIQHMQYLAWPDHGVPSDPQLFLDFTEKVRAVRKKSLLEEIDLSLKQMRLLGTDHNDGNELPCGLGSEDGESPEELILPPSTSIHQYMSAANPPVIIHCSAGKTIWRLKKILLAIVAVYLQFVVIISNCLI